MKRTRLITVTLVLLVLFSSFAYEADIPRDQLIIAEPEIEIVVHQTGAEVVFEFFIQQHSPTGSLVRVRYAPGTVSVDKDGRVIWNISVIGFRLGATRVQYGVLPDGFKQRTPDEGAAPALEIGKEYRVFAYSGGGGEATFVYKGAGG